MADTTAGERGIEQGHWNKEVLELLAGCEVRVVDRPDGTMHVIAMVDGRVCGCGVAPTADEKALRRKMIAARRAVEMAYINFAHYGTTKPSAEQCAAKPLPGSPRSRPIIP